jgi:molecular chaperone DnaK
MSTAAYGIDLGTTNSCIARFADGTFKVVPIDAQSTVPSVVAWDGREWLVGQRAANYAMLAPDQAVRSIKRHMGDAQYKVRLGNAELSPTEVSAKILAYLKREAETATGDRIDEVVITVPAWFNEPQRRATLEAGALAGLKVTRIINEPTAAALAYEVTETKAEGRDERWLVYDLGGGTFDVSVLSIASGYKEVLASCGNTFLGGDDFDHRIVLYLVDVLKDQHGVDISGDKLIMARLRHLAEQSKMVLSTELETRIEATLQFNERSLALATVLTRPALNGMIEDYVASTLAKAQQALEEARVQAADLNRILLVGGSTRIPLVQERITAALTLAPDAYVDVDLSVALGAAVQSALDHGLTYAQIVVDIAPHALGVAAVGEEDYKSYDHEEFEPEVFAEHMLGSREAGTAVGPLTFVPVIRRNSRIPAKFVEEFYTGIDNQTQVEVAVYQGESRKSRDNTFIGAFYAAIPPMPAGSPVHIGFEYDQNGLIHISVAEQGSSRVLKRFTMDLRRSAASNSEVPTLGFSRTAADTDADADEAVTVVDAPETVINFLIEKVEAKLAAAPADAYPRIEQKLARYRELLAVGDDSAIDAVEDDLYAWLDDDGSGVQSVAG